MIVSRLITCLPCADEGYGWFGTLTTISVTSMYKLKLTVEQTLSLTAPRVALSTELRLSAGWNHLPYLRPESWPLSTGLPSLAYLTGDFIKSQSSFATFCSAAEPLQTIGSSTCSLPSPLSECLIRA